MGAPTGSLEGGRGMAVDTFMAYVGVYPGVAEAEADYQLVKDLQGEHLPDDAPVGPA